MNRNPPGIVKNMAARFMIFIGPTARDTNFPFIPRARKSHETKVYFFIPVTDRLLSRVKILRSLVKGN